MTAIISPRHQLSLRVPTARSNFPRTDTTCTQSFISSTLPLVTSTAFLSRVSLYAYQHPHPVCLQRGNSDASHCIAAGNIEAKVDDTWGTRWGGVVERGGGGALPSAVEV
eukprot:GFKZ01013991.1.p2 GENE.GFKZ01013991.1~~GFKZ01013991.1.p2  ORF type:complete len:110 (-),score=8.06 GFKZ01013991.1:1829-2158(-)